MARTAAQDVEQAQGAGGDRSGQARTVRGAVAGPRGSGRAVRRAGEGAVPAGDEQLGLAEQERAAHDLLAHRLRVREAGRQPVGQTAGHLAAAEFGGRAQPGRARPRDQHFGWTGVRHGRLPVPGPGGSVPDSVVTRGGVGCEPGGGGRGGPGHRRPAPGHRPDATTG